MRVFESVLRLVLWFIRAACSALLTAAKLAATL